MAQVSNDNDSNKHVQFDINTASKRQPPKALTYSFIKGQIVTLQTEIATLLETLGTQHVDLHSKALQKQKQLDWLLNNEDLIPKLAHIDFNFHVTKAAKQSN
eukprot:5872667-Ditylum_brightwellii.AAC.1